MRKQKENWNDWQYYGLFLDKETRDGLILFLENCRWDYLYEELSKVYLDHCTLLHQAQYNEDPFVGNSIKYWLDCMLKFGCTRTQLLLSHVGYSDKAPEETIQWERLQRCLLSEIFPPNEEWEIEIWSIFSTVPVERIKEDLKKAKQEE